MDTGSFTGFNLELRDDGIAWFQFSTPERLNGMTTAIKRDLIEAVTQAQMDNAVRVLVFTGTGRAFCAGDDLKAYQGAKLGGTPLVPGIAPGHDSGIGTYNGLRIISQRLNTAVRTLDKLSIAAINGIAIQTGFSLALSCDFRIAADTARMGSATLRFGLLPDEGGQYLLLQMMGLPKTLDFLMRKKIVTADEALELGLVSEVVPAENLERAAMDMATELANGPQVSMRLLKRSVYNAAELTWDQALDEIAAKTAISDHHPDAREGVTAFHEKRDAKFNEWLGSA
ncbi:MAG: enoyl-CoA hydratase/isomerase family protein [Pseudomonadales bacterium]|jgi:2-(1,2-epoxy-1,2-dihydrophenyl)acetyl-CoA isomerase|nr:enoyl-CoA hydratase/isomerase family protein [Pseudomonadales bacterium]MDP6471819.1 enoyl-CoA hydratase/isomerase family protein [Pseudomonadales bacterium]MDP6828767.1 enoyl-CoA hydratase/isomerase family protein [Pseudomonadales bacterium]MDP6970300.1 enoyl-CoA hydratase/isomerase family protein [Pseudomonadales bacterium]|tara:strand:- start:1539 stop:2393 length:855 start_codon:yes stop_codon:yes gene_type:complete